jgi:hypothetical protein
MDGTGKESWRGSTVMRSPDGDKVIIKRDADGHFVYLSVHRDGLAATKSGCYRLASHHLQPRWEWSGSSLLARERSATKTEAMIA